MEVEMKFDFKQSVILSATTVAIVLVLLNLVSRNWFKRLDLTDNKMYSLSESSKNVLDQIDDLLTIKVYFSDDLPGEYGNNRRYLQDILEEYEAISDGNLRFEFYKPESDQKLEEEAQKTGIQPVQLQVVENDKMEVKRVLMGLTIHYEDQKEVIPLIQSTTGLEYEISTKIKKLVDTNKTIIAMADTDDKSNSKNQNISSLLRQRYQVRNVNLSTVVSENIDVILINGVEDSLSSEVKKNLIDFISRGGNVFLAQGRIHTDLQTQQATPIQSDIFDLLNTYGITIAENLVLDKHCSRVSVQQNMGFIRMNVPMEYPFLPIVRNFNEDEAMVSGLEQLSVFFPSEIMMDSLLENVNITPLFSSSKKSSTMSGNYNLNPDPKANPALRMLNQKGKSLAVRTEITNSETGTLGQLILVSDSRFMLDDGGGGIPENHIFLMNAVDYLAGDQELIKLRSREITNRPLEEISDEAKKTWKWVNITLPSLLIVGFGFFRLQRQRQRASIMEEIYD